MKARKAQIPGQKDLFRPRLEDIIDHNHELVVLAPKFDWQTFDKRFGASFADGVGRPALDTRLMVGLQYLKYLHNVSDEVAVERFKENPYWQFFCGNEFFEHELPCNPSSLVRWRKRIGPGGAEAMLAETVGVAGREGVMKKSEASEIYLDTTVQPKAIKYPTDGPLIDTARRMLVRLAAKEGIKLRQSYKHLGRKTLQIHCRQKHKKEWKRAKRSLRKLRTFLGRVIRDIERKADNPSEQLRYGLGVARKIHGQKPGSKGRIYSVHAPEVQCITKNKAHKKHEFGCKVSVATTVRTNWIVGISAHVGHPFDGHTVPDMLCQVRSVTGEFPNRAYCDRGYKGSEGHIFGTHVYLQGTRKTIDDKTRRRLRSRSAIEPIIGHLKAEHRLDRNFLLGIQGDRINALMAGCAFNLRKLVRAILLAFWRGSLTHLWAVLSAIWSDLGVPRGFRNQSCLLGAEV